MDVLTLYKLNDCLIELKGLTNNATGEFVNDAEVKVTLYTKAGTEVAGQVWPTTLSYVDNTSGVYRATLTNTLAVTVGTHYNAVMTAVGGPGLQARWDLDVVCRKRRR